MAALVFMCLPALAAAGERIALDRAIADALMHNRELVAAREGVDVTAARVAEARAALFPRVSFAESWQRGNEPVFAFSSVLSARRFGADTFAVDALNRPRPVGFFQGIFAIEQVVFDGGRTRAGVRAATGRRDVTVAAIGELESTLVMRVTEVYGRLLRAESARGAATAAVAAAEEDVSRAERRRDAGLVTDADVLSLVVHLGDMRQRAIQARGDAAVAAAELNWLTGAPVTRDLAVEEPLPPVADVTPTDMPALLSEAEAARPELRRADATVAVAEAEARQASAAWWPQVVAHGTYHVAGTRVGERASAWIVGGELRWTWSTGGAQLSAARAAAHAAARASAERDDARAAVHVDVVTALRALETAVAGEAVARAAVDQARESERIIRERFNAGRASVTDVLRASTAALDAEVRRVSVLVNRLHAGAALDRALGRVCRSPEVIP